MSFYKIWETRKGIRFMSGKYVYDERVVEGRPVIGYMNAAGQIWNENHLGDEKYMDPKAESDMMKGAQTFKLTIGGKALEGGWTVKEVSVQENRGMVTLIHETIPVEVTQITEILGDEWLARSLKITNTGSEYMAIDKVAPLAGTVWMHKTVIGENTYSFDETRGSTDAAGFEVGICPAYKWAHEGDFQFLPVNDRPYTYHGGINGCCSWARPAVVLRNNFTGALFCAELAYSGLWKTVVTPCYHPENTTLSFELSMSCPEDEVLRVLAKGESVVTPAVHFTMTASGFEELVHMRHTYVRECIMPKNDPIGQCRVEANHRGYLADHENEPGIIRDLDLAADVGVELYVIDAGWYGKEPNRWEHNVGNWKCGPWLPNDLYPIIDHAHEKGLYFGLWMEFEAAGANSGLREEHPEFLMRKGDQLLVGGKLLDLSKPEVALWIRNQMEDVISRYKLDMFRIDNHRDAGSGYLEIAGYKENVLWKYYENLYGIMEYLRNKFPNVSFQNCAAGGGRMDFGMLRYFNHSEMSDWTHAPRVQRIFAGTIAQLPPETLMQAMGTEISEQVLQGDLKFQIHSMLGSRFIMRGIAPNVEERNPILQEALASHIAFYKEKLRPILTSGCKVYMHTDVTGGIMADEPWLAYEISAPDGKSGYALVFRLGHGGENSLTIKPRGIKRGINYKVMLDREADEFTVCGQRLKEDGITVYAQKPLISELIYWEEAVDIISL